MLIEDAFVTALVADVTVGVDSPLHDQTPAFRLKVDPVKVNVIVLDVVSAACTVVYQTEQVALVVELFIFFHVFPDVSETDEMMFPPPARHIAIRNSPTSAPLEQGMMIDPDEVLS